MRPETQEELANMIYEVQNWSDATLVAVQLWPYLAAQPPAAPVETGAPGHDDLMVAPESIDAFMEANPLPPAHSSAGNVPPERRFLIDALDALEAINSEIVLTGHLKELVDCALAARNADFSVSPQTSHLTVAIDPAPLADRWPLGCHSPNSCSRNGRCMYVGCKHDGKDISAIASAFTRPHGECK